VISNGTQITARSFFEKASLYYYEKKQRSMTKSDDGPSAPVGWSNKWDSCRPSTMLASTATLSKGSEDLHYGARCTALNSSDQNGGGSSFGSTAPSMYLASLHPSWRIRMDKPSRATAVAPCLSLRKLKIIVKIGHFGRCKTRSGARLKQFWGCDPSIGKLPWCNPAPSVLIWTYWKHRNVLIELIA